MSLEPNPRKNDYVGDGSTDTYDFDFHISNETELVVKTLASDYTEATLVLNTDYTVSGVDDDDGGSITLIDGSMMAEPLASGVHIAIIGRLPIEQQNNIGNQGSFRPDVIEEEFDNLTKVDQEQQEQIGRSFKIPDTIPASSFDTTLPIGIFDPANAGRALIVNATNDGLDLGAVSSGGGNTESYALLDDSNDGDELDATKRNHFCDPGAASFDVDLPDPAANIGRAIDVFNTSDSSGNTVTVNGSIDGDPSATDILGDSESRTYKSNGVEWRTRS